MKSSANLKKKHRRCLDTIASQSEVHLTNYTLSSCFPGGAVMKNLPANAGDTGDASLIPGLGRSLGVGNSNPFQYFCLDNPINRGTWLATVHGLAWTEHAAHCIQALLPDSKRRGR